MEQEQVRELILNLVEHTCKEIITGLSNELKNKSEEYINKFSIKYQIAFEKYLIKAFYKYSKIKTLLYRTEPKFLYDFFECNDLLYDKKKVDPSDIDNVLDISHFTIIKGTGGIGKTTLMKHFFVDELKKENLIPIFFELKDLNNSEESLEDCIYNSIVNLGCDFEKKYFEYAMKSGKFLILLDGYDEISSIRLQGFFKELEEMTDKYESNYYIMSSRPNEDFISFQRFTILESCAFSEEKAINLIKRIEYDKNTKERFIRELEKGLYQTHYSFASNPLLLTIMLLTYNDYAEIPDKLHVFYEQAFDTLYTKHDATKSGYKRELKSKLPKDVFIKIFSEFCFRSYMKEKIEFRKEDLDEIFKKIKKKKIQFKNSEFLQDLISSICLMYKEGEVYRFTHRSFQEYFSARYILELSDELHFSIRAKNEFLVDIVRKYRRKPKYFQCEENNKEEKEAVINKINGSARRIIITIREMLNDPVYFRFVKTKDCNRDVEVMVNLLRNLKESHNTIEQELEDMLN